MEPLRIEVIDRVYAAVLAAKTPAKRAWIIGDCHRSARVVLAAGAGSDAPGPDEAEKAKLREQALHWLDAERATWASLLEDADAQQRAAIAQILQHWTQDADLASVRDDVERLSSSEGDRWRTLWAGVDKLLENANDEP